MDDPDYFAVLFADIFQTTSKIQLDISDTVQSETTNDVTSRSIQWNSEADGTLTDFRLKYAQRVLENVFIYKKEIINFSLATITSPSGDKLDKNIYLVGPVIDPSTGKKDSTTSFKQYADSRRVFVKAKEDPEGMENKELPVSKECIVQAVVCYDFLHSNITKPVCIQKPAVMNPDPSFREAVKVIYNRSRVSCILQNFQHGVCSSLFPPLPPLESIDFKLLKHEAELKMIKKYIAGFTSLIEKFNLSNVAKVPANLWRFLLFLSQDYSVYYSSVRTLCDEHNHSYPTMHARIWMLKCILSIYDGALALLNLRPLDYV